VTPLWIVVLTRRRRAELLGVESGFSRSRCRAVVPGVLACVHMYILYVRVYSEVKIAFIIAQKEIM